MNAGDNFAFLSVTLVTGDKNYYLRLKREFENFGFASMNKFSQRDSELLSLGEDVTNYKSPQKPGTYLKIRVYREDNRTKYQFEINNNGYY